MKVEYRRATEEDIEGIIELCNECFDENTPLAYAKKVFEETKQDDDQIYLVGVIDGKIIAHTKITIIPTIFEEMNTYAILNHVCVKEEYRRHNIGTSMLDEVTKICEQKNCKTIKLWSKNFRIPAHTCYKKYGFKADDATFFAKEIEE